MSTVMNVINDLCTLTGLDLELEGVGEFSPDPNAGISDAEIRKTQMYINYIINYGFLQDIPDDLSSGAKTILTRVNNFFKGKYIS